jgi:hypothetical protein
MLGQAMARHAHNNYNGYPLAKAPVVHRQQTNIEERRNKQNNRKTVKRPFFTDEYSLSSERVMDKAMA